LSRRRLLLVSAIAAGCGVAMIAVARSSPKASGGAPGPPSNPLRWEEVAGRSVEGRLIRLRQLGEPSIERSVLVFGCVHGDECGASGLSPTIYGCPDPYSNVYVVPNLNPDGAAGGTRLNGRGVDLNRNFAAEWIGWGEPGDPEYAGPGPTSEPETRLAARIVRRVQPRVTLWFHQHRARRPLVRAWGQSVPAARRFARLAGLPFKVLPWLRGTAPNWQNHAFPGTSSFVVELPRGRLGEQRKLRLQWAIVHLARWVSHDGHVVRTR
jgi:murein peptide amidase A